MHKSTGRKGTRIIEVDTFCKCDEIIVGLAKRVYIGRIFRYCLIQ